MQNEIFETQDGSHSILSKEYGVSYHSRYGAVQESQHVFIEAGLYAKGLAQKEIAILEFGFGSGLNAFLTMLEAEKHQWNIYYETIEAYPINIAQASQLNYPTLLNASHLQEQFLQMHACPPDVGQQPTPNFIFRKILQRFEDVNYSPTFDLIYFDAFAPSAQPDLWNETILVKAYQALKSQGIFVTYCAKGEVKRILKNIGFQVEALPGPPGKREMTRGVKK
ncbi:MAG: tRNA (5-methylaminomethyl-2-thiouridine)(34)-methyltransferase MnmD [Saprospiraceae bacterium]|nr:tRNA (5-methylaminomethyl-2-thiouridine)(34)-methyltransferase MnmD [Saprospiraceae bacterium]